MNHCGIPAQVLFWVGVVGDSLRDSLRDSLGDRVVSEVLEVVVIVLLKVFHIGGDSSGTMVPSSRSDVGVVELGERLLKSCQSGLEAYSMGRCAGEMMDMRRRKVECRIYSCGKGMDEGRNWASQK